VGTAGCLSVPLLRTTSCEQQCPRHGSQPSPATCLPLPPGSQKCCKRRFGWLLEHLEPQTACQFDDRGAPAVDFFGRVENLDEDMQVWARRYRQYRRYSAVQCRC
jgi:hypothetical protein